MKIPIPKTIQTSNGEVEIPNIPARTAFERGLVEGWKAAMIECFDNDEWFDHSDKIEFIEGEE